MFLKVKLGWQHPNFFCFCDSKEFDTDRSLGGIFQQRFLILSLKVDPQKKSSVNTIQHVFVALSYRWPIKFCGVDHGLVARCKRICWSSEAQWVSELLRFNFLYGCQMLPVYLENGWWLRTANWNCWFPVQRKKAVFMHCPFFGYIQFDVLTL